MSESERPQSPFAGMADFSARTPVRVFSPDEIERMLAEHWLYLETEYHQGHRANFASVDLPGEISWVSICAGSRWTAPCSAGPISPEPICKARTSSGCPCLSRYKDQRLATTTCVPSRCVSPL